MLPNFSLLELVLAKIELCILYHIICVRLNKDKIIE